MANVTPERRKETSLPLTSHDAAATILDDPERMIVYPGGRKGKKGSLLIQVDPRRTRGGERNRCSRQFHYRHSPYGSPVCSRWPFVAPFHGIQILLIHPRIIIRPMPMLFSPCRPIERSRPPAFRFIQDESEFDQMDGQTQSRRWINFPRSRSATLVEQDSFKQF